MVSLVSSKLHLVRIRSSVNQISLVNKIHSLVRIVLRSLVNRTHSSVSVNRTNLLMVNLLMVSLVNSKLHLVRIVLRSLVKILSLVSQISSVSAIHSLDRIHRASLLMVSLVSSKLHLVRILNLASRIRSSVKTRSLVKIVLRSLDRIRSLVNSNLHLVNRVRSLVNRTNNSDSQIPKILSSVIVATIIHRKVMVLKILGEILRFIPICIS